MTQSGLGVHDVPQLSDTTLLLAPSREDDEEDDEEEDDEDEIMHEIITLQFGQRSNYLATHFWNVQESYFTYDSDKQEQEQEPAVPAVNHDVHFRAGQAPDGTDTYTPRTVIYDLKGGFGALRKINALYEVVVDHADDAVSGLSLWDGPASTQRQPPITPSPYQVSLEGGLPTVQLHDGDVRYWSDFNRVYLHPRSVVQLTNEHELSSQLMPLEQWSTGEELFGQLDRAWASSDGGNDGLLDRDLRFFAEECDHMQGFQAFTSADDAWGGYAAKYVEAVRDEYPKTSIWTWALEDTAPASRPVRLRRGANSLRSLRALAQQSSAYVRLATLPASLPPYVNLPATSADWRTTALLCAAVESVTLPTRLQPARDGYAPLSWLDGSLNVNGNQNVFELSMSVNHATTTTAATATTGRRGNAPVNSHHPNAVDGSDPAAAAAAAAAEQGRRALDISLWPAGQHDVRAGGPVHTFSQIDMSRGGKVVDPGDDDDGDEQQHQHQQHTRRIKFTANVPFPKLDAFPADLFRPIGRSDEGGFAITAALAASSHIKTSLLAARDSFIRAAGGSSITLDERESLYSDVTNVAYNYSHGWEDSDADSGSEDD